MRDFICDLRKKEKLFQESLIDPWKEKMDEKVWDTGVGSSPVLNRDFHMFLMETIQKNFREWLDNLSVATITGSITTEFYTPKTDIDVHLYFKVSEPFMLEELEVVADNLKGEIDFEGHPIEFFCKSVEFLDEDVNVSDGAYSLGDDEWLKMPVKQEKNIDTLSELLNSVRERAGKIAERLDVDMGSIVRNLQDIERFLKAARDGNPKYEGMIEKLLRDLEKDIKGYVDTLDNARKTRASAFNKNLEDLDNESLIETFKTNTALPQNLMFKYLQKWSYFNLLRVFKTVLKDNDISLDEVDKLEEAIVSMYKNIFEVA